MDKYHLGHNRMPLGLRFALFKFHLRNEVLHVGLQPKKQEAVQRPTSKRHRDGGFTDRLAGEN